ncbi:MAG: hypothetical protein ACREJO_06565 [Phycisphaerales bacterium]
MLHPPGHPDDPAGITLQDTPMLRDPRPVSIARRLVWVAVFLAAVFAVDRLVGLAFSQVVLRSQYRYSRLYRGDIDADIVIVGSSRGLHSLYAPEMTQRLGVPVYNLSANSLGMDALACIVGDYLDRNRAPKAIIVEITAATGNPGESITAFQPYFGESQRFQTAFHTYQPDRYWACRACHSFRYNGNAIEKCLLYLRRSDQDWISPAARIIPPEILARRAITGEITIAPAEARAWAEIVAAAKAKSVTLIPIIAPYVPGAFGDRDIRAEFVRQLEADAPDAPPILDYSRAVTIDDAFSDRVHTNAKGAGLLLDVMIRDGVFDRVLGKPPG